MKRAFRSRRVIFGQGVRPATVIVDHGTIERIAEHHEVPSAYELFDGGDAVLMAGLCDSHVHVNEPGRTEWEGFDTATCAAAAGGITTLVDMPLNCIPVTTTRAALETKLHALGGLCHIDCGFWGGLVPGNVAELEPLIDAGVLGFKAFLVPSGIDEFPNVTEADLRQAMPILARRNVPLLVHAELDLGTQGSGPPHHYTTYLDSRPPEMERAAIRLMIELARQTRCHVHIVHLSAAEALTDLATARRAGVPITVETCPHYLTFAAEEIPEGATQYKCAPPIRERPNREQLWRALLEGTIDFVVSDHSPCTPHLKQLEQGDFLGAWGGISSVQLALPAVWTAARERGVTLEQLTTWLSARPAAFAGLDGRKGRIAPGYDADLVFWRPEAQLFVEPTMIQHKHKLTPYAGRTLSGVVEQTILRGEPIYRNGSFLARARGMQLLGRKSAA